jgi:hypothetical protein
LWRNWYLRCRDFASIKRWLILWPFTVYYGKSGVRLRAFAPAAVPLENTFRRHSPNMTDTAFPPSYVKSMKSDATVGNRPKVNDSLPS